MKISNDDSELLPADTIFKGAVEAIAPDTYMFTDTTTGKDVERISLKWRIKILEGDYKERVAFGSTWARIGGKNNPLRDWIEALLGRELAPGEEFDTDDFLGMVCEFTVRHGTNNKTGRPFATIDTVFPAVSALTGASGGYVPTDDVPF
jgi:hypothetical protein